MKKYEYLPHTSDEKFRAYGNSIEEAFENAAYALTDVITDHTKIKKNITKKISVESEDYESLLYDFLEEFLILLDSEDFLLCSIKSIKIDDNKLKAELVGDNKIENYDIKTHVKAVTYQQMFVEKKNDLYVLQVIVDI